MKQASNTGTGKPRYWAVDQFAEQSAALQVDERRVVEAAQALLLRTELQLELFAS